MKKFLLLVLVLATDLVIGQDKEGAEALVSEGIYLHDRGNYTGAIAKYDAALRLDANNYLAMAEKALTLHAMGNNKEAVDLCSKTVELHSDDEDVSTVYVTWGNSLDALGKSDAAIEVFEQGIEKYPDNYLLHFNAGITYTGQQEYAKALEYFHKSVSLNPEHAGSHNAISRLLFEDNRIPSILAVLRFFVVEPKGPRAESNLELLNALLYGNVEKTGKNSISISFDGDFFKDSTEVVKPNDFSSIEFAFTLSTALALSSENKKMNDAERLNELLISLADLLEEEKEKNIGFYWDYYVPYFLEMNKKGHTLAFAYIVYSASGDKYVKKWQAKNSSMILKFYKWNDDYTWFKL